MKKRFGISRCCCGDGGGAGQCLDSCLANWGGNSATATGNLTTVVPADYSDAITNDLWFLSRDRIQPSPPNVSGLDGAFQFDGNGFRQTAVLEKRFSFDYRTNTTIDLSTIVDVPPVSFVNNVANSIYIELLGGRLILLGGYSPPNAFSQPARVADLDGTIQDSSPRITMRIVATIGQTLATFQRSNVPYIDNNGIEQIGEGCVENKEVTIERYVDGALFSTTTTQAEFAGIRCYSAATIAGQGWSGSFLSPAVPVFTSNTTLSVT